MIYRRLPDMEQELREAGHQVEVHCDEGPPGNELMGCEWYVLVDGVEVVREVGQHEMDVALAKWMKGNEG